VPQDASLLYTDSDRFLSIDKFVSKVVNTGTCDTQRAAFGGAWVYMNPDREELIDNGRRRLHVELSVLL
jgi:hypothetical protein